MTSSDTKNLRSTDLLDPELVSLAAAMERIELNAENLPAFRASSLLGTEVSEAARLVVASTIEIPGADGITVPLAVFQPPGSTGNDPVILHMHGGGFITGSTTASAARNREIVADLGCAVVSVEYRLAPEHHFPAAIEDCYAALDWVARNGDKIGVDAERLVLKGESAGGGLAAALAILARDRGEHRPLFQHLTYPMLDDRTGTRHSPHIFAGEYVWTAQNNIFGWTSLLGGKAGEPDVSPYAAAARATDLSGLPPAYIMTGALDLFLEEDVDYARRLACSGVPVELHVFPGAFHGFDLAPDAQVAKTARGIGRAALARVLRVPG